MAFSTQYRRVTDRRTDRQTSSDGIVCATHKHHAEKRGRPIRVYQVGILFMQSQGKVVFKRGTMHATMCSPGTNCIRVFIPIWN